MVVPGLIVLHHPFLDALGSHLPGDVDFSIRAAFRREHRELNGIEGFSRIAPCNICQELLRLRLQYRVVGTHAPLLIIDGPVQKHTHILLCQRLEFKDHRPGNQSAVHLEIRVLRRGSNQNQRSVLHKGKKIILLPLIEAVNLIHEKNRFFLVHSEGILGFGHDLLHVFFPSGSGVDLGKFRAGGVGDDLRQRSLSGSRRAIKNDGTQLVRLDRAVEHLVLSDDMLLPHHLIQGPRAYSGSQRGFLFHRIASCIFK